MLAQQQTEGGCLLGSPWRTRLRLSPCSSPRPPNGDRRRWATANTRRRGRQTRQRALLLASGRHPLTRGLSVRPWPFLAGSEHGRTPPNLAAAMSQTRPRTFEYALHLGPTCNGLLFDGESCPGNVDARG